MVIFLKSLSFMGGVSGIGALLGFGIAISLGWLLFIEAKKIRLSTVFTISSVLLILFAAGLVGHGVHELEEAGIVSPIIDPLYDINPAQNPDGSYPLLHEDGLIGGFLEGLVGYNGDPSLMEVISMIFYLVVVLGSYWYLKKIQNISAHTSLEKKSSV